jgi:hypothetical protein
MAVQNQLKFNNLFENLIKKTEEVKTLEEAMNSLIFEGSGVENLEKLKDLQEQYETAIEGLNKINEELKKANFNTLNDIENTHNSIMGYRKTLMNNNSQFNKYSDDIKNNMQLVATRDRMLQISQERNIYKQKIIYVLISMIIALTVLVISGYTIYSKFKK